jgi:hypothetical protein
VRQVSLCPRLRGWPWRRVSKVFGRWIRRLLGRGRGGLGALLSCAFRRLAGDRTARPVRPVLLLLHVDEMSTPRGRTTSCGRGRHTGHPRGCSHSLQTSGGCTHARATLSLCISPSRGHVSRAMATRSLERMRLQPQVVQLLAARKIKTAKVPASPARAPNPNLSLCGEGPQAYGRSPHTSPDIVVHACAEAHLSCALTDRLPQP